MVNLHLTHLQRQWWGDGWLTSVPCSTFHTSGEKWAHYQGVIMLFTYLLGFRGNVVLYLLELRLCCHGVFFKILDCKKITRQVHQEAILIIKYSRKSYHADNAVDKATINLSDLLLVDVGSTSTEGMFHGSSSATCINGFRIERPALWCDISHGL